MIKRIALFLIFISMVALVGCGYNYAGPLSCVSRTSIDGTTSLLDMTEDVHKEILSILNRGVWINDVARCESDFSFETKNEKIYYHSECGTFNDATNERYMKLTETEKAKINQLLGAEPFIIGTYEVTNPEHTLGNDEIAILVKHYEMSEGTWKTDNYTYKYRLEITGRMPNAVKDTTFVFLSNIEDISFEKAMMASGLSSNMEDYFDSETAIFVGIR